MGNIEIQLNKAAMLSGQTLTFRPTIALDLGNIQAVVFEQLRYLAHKSGVSVKPVRISYSKLQKIHFPFISRRWLIEIIQQLESLDLIAITRTGRIKAIEIVDGKAKEDSDILATEVPDVAASDSNPKTSLHGRMQVSVELAKRIGFLEAIVLQQIHVRHKGEYGDCWVIRSYEQWQREVFMFVGIATVKRLFSNLAKQKLIFVEKHNGDNGVVNCYRVNYLQVADVLEIEPPQWVAPTPEESGYDEKYMPKYTSPLAPVKAKLK